MAYTITKDLVSILTPCYNGAKIIHRLLDSVLQQDYPCIEMIVVDDGSTDESKEIIVSYYGKFKEKGYSLSYIYQENKGQASAINNGLKKVTGEFLIWPDSDDFFSSSSSISTFVLSFAKLGQEYGVVRCYANVLDEQNLHILYQRKHNVDKERIFEEYFTCIESIAGAGLYMVRMEAFDDVNPSRDIFSEEKPQNWQLLLPILYFYKIFTIKKPLHNIVVASHSHSREKKTYKEHIAGFNGYLAILKNTLSKIKMNSSVRDRFLEICVVRNILDKLDIALKFYQRKEVVRYIKQLKEHNYQLSSGKKIKVALLILSPALLRIMTKVVRMVKIL